MTTTQDPHDTTAVGIGMGVAFALAVVGFAAVAGSRKEPFIGNVSGGVSVSGFDEMFRAYVEAAFGSSTDDDGEPLDRHFTPSALSYESRMTMMQDVGTFLRDHVEDIDGRYEEAGQDFWLTRNRDGAGFWDGDWPEPAASRLTEAAHRYGSADLYTGDDGLLYVTPLSFDLRTGGLNSLRERVPPKSGIRRKRGTKIYEAAFEPEPSPLDRVQGLRNEPRYFDRALPGWRPVDATMDRLWAHLEEAVGRADKKQVEDIAQKIAVRHNMPERWREILDDLGIQSGRLQLPT